MTNEEIARFCEARAQRQDDETMTVVHEDGTLMADLFRMLADVCRAPDAPDYHYREIARVPVDSATLALIDPFYLRNTEIGEHLPAYGHLGAAPEDRGKLHKLIELPTADVSEPALGVAFSTGMGDGTYPVTARFADEMGLRVAEIRVHFLPHPYF